MAAIFIGFPECAAERDSISRINTKQGMAIWRYYRAEQVGFSNMNCNLLTRTQEFLPAALPVPDCVTTSGKTVFESIARAVAVYAYMSRMRSSRKKHLGS
jgi:hypothetical protein